MDYKELIRRIDEDNQVLTIEGNALDRSIKLNGLALDLDESKKYGKFTENGFNWGYIGAGPKQLSFAIINAVLDILPEKAIEVMDSFENAVIKFLPSGSFTAYVSILDFLNFEDGAKNLEKKVSAFQFMKVDYNGLRVPKALDVVNLPFSKFHYKKGTWEEEWLKNISTQDYRKFTDYIRTESERYDHRTPDNKISIQFKRDDLGGWVFYNGIGSGTYEGHLISEYEKVT